MTRRRVNTRSLLAFAGLWGVGALLYGCSGSGSADSDSAAPGVATTGERRPEQTAEPDEPKESPELLSEWGQLSIRDGHLQLGDGVVPYTLSSALFSDYAHKLRTVWLPDGSTPATYDDEGVFDLPVGTVITKTFYYPAADTDQPGSGRVLRTSAAAPDDLGEPPDLAAVRLIETRVLVRRAEGWTAAPYVWNDDQTEATLQRTGDLLSLTLVDGDADTPFTYTVPDVNQCASCHATNHTTGSIQPIGPKARHLNIDVDLGDGPVPQLRAWQDLGLLGPTPDPAEIPVVAVWDDDTADLDDRARSYLDINCAHCHSRSGSADTSGLFLESTTELGAELGVCKHPVAAGSGTGGRPVGIAPGDPDQSIFTYRIGSTDPAEMMPELGRALVHDEGLELITAWIASLPGSC